MSIPGFRPSKTEAAEAMAVEVRCYARRKNLEITRELVEGRINEMSGWFRNGTHTYQTECATVANVRTTLRKALEVPL